MKKPPVLTVTDRNRILLILVSEAVSLLDSPPFLFIFGGYTYCFEKHSSSQSSVVVFLRISRMYYLSNVHFMHALFQFGSSLTFI